VKDLLNKIKKFVPWIIVTPIAVCLWLTYTNSAKLVNDFESTIESKDFTPEAESLEVAEIDRTAHRGWKIKAAKSSGDSKLDKIKAEGISAEIFDENDKVKMSVTAGKADVDRSGGITVLYDSPSATIVEKNIKLTADKFLIKKGQPIECIGNVKILLNPEGTNHILAAKALIPQSMDDITLYSISKSLVSGNLLLSGGQMSIEHSGSGNSSKPRKIIVSSGAWVQSGTTTCQSSRLDVLLDAAGKPTVAIFTGSPVANQAGKQIKANKIEYTVSNGSVKAIGGIRSGFL
jgi:lipopolysaccharide assembly outer membrane protein LptD (OstA)